MKSLFNSFWLKNTKSKSLVLLMFMFIFSVGSLQAQNNHHVTGNVYIDAGGFMYIATGDTVRLEGNIITVRDMVEAQRGMISFNGSAGWSSTNNSFVDGYVRSRKTGNFIFPVGQGSYRPAAISKAAAGAPTDAAYYSTALYSTSALMGLLGVTDECWIIQGTTAATITLSWTSDLSGFAADMSQLCIAGWNPAISKWVEIPSATEGISSIFGVASNLTTLGTLSGNAEIIPNDYTAYTLGIRALNLIDCNTTAKTATQDACGVDYYTHSGNIWDIEPLSGLSFDSVKYLVNGVIKSHGATATLDGVQFTAGITGAVEAIAYSGITTDTCRFNVTVDSIPLAKQSDITAANVSVCFGATATITPVATAVTNPTFRWYESQTATTPFFEGASYTTSALTVDTTLYIGVFGDSDCENADNDRKEVTIAVISCIPFANINDINVTNAHICSGSQAFLIASSTLSNPIFRWYESQTSAAILYEGAYYITSALTTDTAFYVSVSNSTHYENIAGERVVATVTIVPPPVAPVLIYDTLLAFKGMPVDLSDAVGQIPGIQYSYYENPDGTGKISGSIVTFNPPKNDYYVIADNAICESSASKIILMEYCPLTVDDAEGNTYKVTSLAGYCWTENLRVTQYADGVPIDFANPYSCSTCPAQLDTIFGLLYDWNSAMGALRATPLPAPTQGICPNGWHIPSQTEWNSLNVFPTKTLNSTQYWLNPPGPGTDDYGFDARPAGWYNGLLNRYQDLYGFTNWWTNDNAAGGVTANAFVISYFCNQTQEEVKMKSDGLSVRCVKD